MATESSPASVKRRLRAWAREEGPPTMREAAEVRSALLRWLERRRPSSILSYDALEGEVALGELVDRLPRHRWLLTRTPSEGWLTIHPHRSARERHRFGYSQPASGAAEVTPGEVDVVIVPGLAFDAKGGRLGRGRGYYDELLARVGPHTDVVGVTVERLVVADIPREPHDIGVGWLATENGVRRVG